VAHEHHDHTADDHGHGIGHVVTMKILLGTWLTLMALTIITVLAARVHFGQFNLVIALAIATIKATLVAMFFMHLRWDKPFHALVVISGILAALLFVGFAFMDGNQYQRDICAHRGANCAIWGDEVKQYEESKPVKPPAGETPALNK